MKLIGIGYRLIIGFTIIINCKKTFNSLEECNFELVMGDFDWTGSNPKMIDLFLINLDSVNQDVPKTIIQDNEIFDYTGLYYEVDSFNSKKINTLNIIPI